jgi:hypothetical protein
MFSSKPIKFGKIHPFESQYGDQVLLKGRNNNHKKILLKNCISIPIINLDMLVFHINHTIIISLCGNKPLKFHAEKWVVSLDYQIPIGGMEFKLDVGINLFYISTSNMEAIMHLLMLCPFKTQCCPTLFHI